MKRFIAFSLGVESTTMCLLYGKGATAIFTDTGSEHKELYARLAYVQEALQAVHGGDFAIHVIKPTQTVKGTVCHTLQEAIEAKKFMPSARKRWCTVEWKIAPMDAFLESQGECELLIGFNADEEPGKDRTGNLMRCANVQYRYPLYEDGYTRDDCKALLRAHQLEPNYPVYMARGGLQILPLQGGERIQGHVLPRPAHLRGGPGARQRHSGQTHPPLCHSGQQEAFRCTGG